jgi:zinc transport system permease protein
VNSQTLNYLSDPLLRGIYLPGVVAAFAIALLGAVLSVPVVLKRLAFVGQGVSHAAFGGVGVAVLLGFGAAGGTGIDALAQLAIIVGFCLGAALLIAALVRRGLSEADTIIGVILVGSMALGAILLQIAHGMGRGSNVAWESLLFGSILNVGPVDAWVAWAFSLASLLVMWWWRRPLLFWGFDEPVSSTYGVRGGRWSTLLMTLLAVATVITMKLAGVVLATALLVLPGATAMCLSRRMGRVLAWSVAVAFLGVAGGVIASFEAGLPTGASIVMVLIVAYGCARGWAVMPRRAANRGGAI